MQIQTASRLLAVLTPLLLACCVPGAPPPNPIIGNWTTQDHNQITLRDDAVIITPDKGKPQTLGPGDCAGVYKLQYGRMMTASLQQSFPTQPDLQSKLKQLLTRPEYPVADVTCDRGGTTYLMLDERRMIAVYRDSGVGGLETYSRL